MHRHSAPWCRLSAPSPCTWPPSGTWPSSPPPLCSSTSSSMTAATSTPFTASSSTTMPQGGGVALAPVRALYPASSLDPLHLLLPPRRRLQPPWRRPSWQPGAIYIYIDSYTPTQLSTISCLLHSIKEKIRLFTQNSNIIGIFGFNLLSSNNNSEQI